VEAGMHSFEHRLPAETGEAVLALVARLNAGGVGPMTVACLLRNTVEAACARRGIAVPAM